MNEKNNDIKFEDALMRLEEQVRRLEGGALTLDESLTAFEEAIKLVKLCNARLEKAELRVRMLTEGADGSITDVPFDSADET